MKILIEDLLPGEEEVVTFRVSQLTEGMLKAIQSLKNPNDLTVYLDE